MPRNAKTVSDQNLIGMYQDELSFGMEQALSRSMTVGAKLTYRKLGESIDDWCDTRPFEKWAAANGKGTGGNFLALLDIQVIAASLNDVQAGLSAGPDEISWVQTAYLIAELVMIPFSAFLAQAMSTRWLFAASAGLFTLSSVLCGIAWDIGSMTVFRALQGFTGGAMIPTVFAVGFTLFTGKQRAMSVYHELRQRLRTPTHPRWRAHRPASPAARAR